MEQIERLEINTHICSQLIFNKGARIHNGVSIVSSKMGVGKTGYPHSKE